MEVFHDAKPPQEGRRTEGDRRKDGHESATEWHAEDKRMGSRRPARRVDRRSRRMTRKTYALLHQSQFTKTADVVKATKFVEPAWLVFTAVLYGFANTVTMGAAGPCFLVALFFHEMGHYMRTKKEGYNPPLFWFVPLLGATMSLPHMHERIHIARIAFAGPLAGLWFTIAVTMMWFGLALTDLPDLIEGDEYYLFLTAFASVVLNLFNLIPIMPLDGGRISSAMSGAWPARMRVLGVVLLLVATAFTRNATMLVVWILVIGSWSWRKADASEKKERSILRYIPPRYRSYKFLRFLLSALLLIVVVGLLYRGIFVTGVLYGQRHMIELLGELIFTAFGLYFVHGYFLQWRHPQLYYPMHENRGKRVLGGDAKKMTTAYFALIASYLSVTIVLFVLYHWRMTPNASWF